MNMEKKSIRKLNRQNERALKAANKKKRKQDAGYRMADCARSMLFFGGLAIVVAYLFWRCN